MVEEYRTGDLIFVDYASRRGSNGLERNPYIGVVVGTEGDVVRVRYWKNCGNLQDIRIAPDGFTTSSYAADSRLIVKIAGVGWESEVSRR